VPLVFVKSACNIIFRKFTFWGEIGAKLTSKRRSYEQTLQIRIFSKEMKKNYIKFDTEAAVIRENNTLS